MSADLIAGFLSGAVLIIAIGAQNAFVLRQGLRREHVLAIVLVCAGADALLIAAGIAGAEMIPFPELSRFLHIEESRAVMRRMTDFFLPELEIER